MEAVDPVLPKYRTFWQRLLANIIDFIVFLPLFILEEFALPTQTGDAETRAINFIITMAMNEILLFTYSIWMIGKFGQTVGKMAMKIKVLDEADEVSYIGYRRAFYRDAPLAISEFIALVYMVITFDVSEQSIAIKLLNFATGIWILAELITMFQNVRRRAIHDILAGSVVVKM